MATGDTLCVFFPMQGETLTSSAATLYHNNWHPVIAFDGASQESIVFRNIMPRHYEGGGVTVYLHYHMNTDTSGDIDWDVAFEACKDAGHDLDSDSFATAKSVDNTTVPTTAGVLDVVSIAFTDGAEMDSIAAGDMFRMKVTRDAAADTTTGDAYLSMVEIKET